VITRNEIKLVSSLSRKKQREKHRLFVLEGEKIILDYIASGHAIQYLYCLQIFKDKYLSARASKNIHEIKTIGEDELKKISQLKTPNQALAVAPFLNHSLDLDDLSGKNCLVLDQLGDPGNLGTLIRTADWFGIHDIICSRDTVDLYNPKTIQSTMGSLARVKVHYAKLDEILPTVNSKVQVIGTYMKGQSIYDTRLQEPCWIVLGSESHGISKSLTTHIGQKISIPSFSAHPQQPESLNVAIAGAIACSELKRR
jgi:TrmH family RNA methyltransferase